MDIIKKIKEKKELQGLPDTIVKKTLETYLKKHKIIVPKSEKEAKIIVKEVRAQLRNYVGRFKSSQSKREKLLNEANIPKLLDTHSSTKERKAHYQTLIQILKKCSPNTILDLACGINPIAIAQEFSNVYYAAIDINKQDLTVVKEYFTANDIQGSVVQKDIRDMKTFPEVDVTLLLKILDIIETKDHAIAQRIMQSLKTKHCIVSFATRTLSGKPMRIPRRGWFEKILKDCNLNYNIEKIPNEIFYCITY